MPMAWGGPIAFTKYVVNDLEWPQCWRWIIIPMAWGRPIVSQKRVVESPEWAMRFC